MDTVFWQTGHDRQDRTPLLSDDTPDVHHVHEECELVLEELRRFRAHCSTSNNRQRSTVGVAHLRRRTLAAIATLRRLKAESKPGPQGRRLLDLEHSLQQCVGLLNRVEFDAHRGSLANEDDLQQAPAQRPVGMLPDESTTLMHKNESILAASGSVLQNIQKSLEATRDVSLDSLQHMDTQGHTLRSSAERASATRSMLDVASLALRKMHCRAVGDRCLLAMLLVLLSLIAGFLIYFMFFRQLWDRKGSS